MSLAAFLCLEGEELLDYQWERDSCWFVFEKTQSLMDSVTDFISGNALVEPSRYNTVFSEIKKKMFGSRTAQVS